MTFTIEPMLNAGDYRIRTMKDGWTVKTKDRSLSAQYEHTIVVTENGCEILTLRKDDTIPAIITRRIMFCLMAMPSHLIRPTNYTFTQNHSSCLKAARE